MAQQTIVATPKKRGRPKKIVTEAPKLPTFSDKYEQKLIEQLFEADIQKKLQEQEDNTESPYYVEDETHVHRKRDGIWDVAVEEEIRYFDPELSYEISGYHPINMESGLDFDPAPFTEAAETFSRTGKYTEYPRDCKPYNDY